MGQRSIAIMYAAEVSAGVEFFPKDTPLIEDFERSKSEHLRPAYSWPDGDKLLVGYWIAVGGSGEDGVPYLGEQFPLDGIEDVPEYRKRLKVVRAAFDRLALWLAKRGCPLRGPEMPGPRLWLTETET
jgi:hypothetical protein